MDLKNYVLTLSAALLLPAALPGQDPMSLRINEILSSNESTPPFDAAGEFEDMLEIYNPTDALISLKDFLVTDQVEKDELGVYHPVMPWKIPAGSIQSKGFVLIFCDSDSGLDRESSAHSSFGLDQDGELVALFTPAGVLVDMVVFPRLAEGTSYGRAPDGEGPFCHMPVPTFKKRSILSGGSLIAQNKPCGNIPPEINFRSYESIVEAGAVNPAADRPLPIQASTWDDQEDGSKAAWVLYKVNDGGEQTLALTWDSFLKKRDPLVPFDPQDPEASLVEDRTRSLWKAEIPGHAAGSVITFTFKVEDGATPALAGADPAVLCAGSQTQGCNTPFRYKVAHAYTGPVVLNELAPLNLNIVRDLTDLAFDDYIELFSAQELSLEGLWLSDNPFRPEGWQFPPLSTIAAGQRLLVWCDDDSRQTRPETGEYHTNFNLSNEGEGIFIFDTAANGLGFIDGFKFGLTVKDIAHSRIPDGDRSAPFLPVLLGSPGASNGTGETQFIRGDADASGGADISDPIIILSHLFQGGPMPCAKAADVDDTGGLDISDPINLLNHLFQGGAPPPPPYPEAGTDPTADSLTCG